MFVRDLSTLCCPAYVGALLQADNFLKDSYHMSKLIRKPAVVEKNCVSTRNSVTENSRSQSKITHSLWNIT